MGQRVGEGVRVGQPQIDMNTLQRLLTQAPSVAGKVLPTIEAFRKLNAPERIKLGAEETLTEITPEGQARVVATGAPKQVKPPSAVEEYNFAVSQGYKGTFDQFKQLGRAVTNVNVGEGQKGFENEMKLAGAFKGEPVYKAFDEMRGSFQQITTGLNQKSPAGDLTAATKFMHKGTSFVFIGIAPSRRKFPIAVRNLDEGHNSFFPEGIIPIINAAAGATV